METPRLTYFDMRGRAEAIRVFLHAFAIEFEDRRVARETDWAALKPTLPFGVLPLFETGGLRLGESQAILRHLERVHAGTPKDERCAAELDMTQEAIAEAQEDLWQFAWRESYYDHLESYAAETLRPRLENLAAWLARRGERTGTWFGDAFSRVDCVAFAYLDEIDAFFPAVLAEFGRLSDLRSRVAALPGVSDYLGSAMRPAVFGMGCTGPKVDPRVAVEPGGTFFSPWSEPLDLGTVARSQRRMTER